MKLSTFAYSSAIVVLVLCAVFQTPSIVFGQESIQALASFLFAAIAAVAVLLGGIARTTGKS